MKSLTVTCKGGTYPVFIGWDTLEHQCEHALLNNKKQYSQIVVICDDKISLSNNVEEYFARQNAVIQRLAVDESKKNI